MSTTLKFGRTYNENSVRRAWSRVGLGLAAISLFGASSQASEAEIAERLLRAYPGIITGVTGNAVTFAGGGTLPLDDGKGKKAFAEWLEHPDIEDMFAQSYSPGELKALPPLDFDPGRARNEAFFTKIYGDCRKGEVEKSLVTISWLPKKAAQKLKITRINGVAERLAAVSSELDKLPSKFDIDLFPAAGTYNCRVIAGTKNLSGHGLGIAIDIALKNAHYWRWEKKDPNGTIAYRNKIPDEIVRIFEKHGFIWGGKWHHFDTMHFEYRPELLPPAESLAPAGRAQ